MDDFTKMSDFTTENLMIEREGVFNEEKTKRFELTFVCSGMETMETEMSILVIGLNPNSRDILTMDTTTFLTLNNLMPMGFSTITICNLFANIFRKLRMSAIPDNDENMEYLRQVLERNFDRILLCYGNTCINNQRVQKEKNRLMELLRPWKDRVVVIMDRERTYEDLRTIHPLMAGRYFPGDWELIPYEMPEEKALDNGEDEPGGEGRDTEAETEAGTETGAKAEESNETAAKKSSRKRKKQQKESTEKDDSDCEKSEAAGEAETESAESDT